MKYVLPINLDLKRSYGSHAYDKKSDSEYLDFFSLYSSLPLGYNHPCFDEEFYNEINEVAHTKMANNICETDQFNSFFETFKEISFSEYIHFTSTGALAVESAIKTAMEYKKVNNPIVLSVEKAFHGVNSWGLVTSRYGITGKRMEFFPNNNWPILELEEIENYLLNKELDNVVAVIVEPIQCTNGDIYLNREILARIRKLCSQNDICFILDEIQTGFGTTGKMWYYEHLQIKPDILVFGKKSQVSGIVVDPKYKAIFDSPYQKLDVTFDGDLIDMIRCKYILKAYSKYNILDNVKMRSSELRNQLSSKMMNYRTCGNLIAFDFETQPFRDQFVEKAFKNNLIINKAGIHTVRLRPNLAITKDDVQKFTDTVHEIL